MLCGSGNQRAQLEVYNRYYKAMNVAGSGDLTLKGKAENFNAKLASSGDIHWFKLDSKNVEAHVSIPVSYIDKLKIGNKYSFKIGNKQSEGSLERLAPMTPGGSDNRLAIFNFDTFFKSF